MTINGKTPRNVDDAVAVIKQAGNQVKRHLHFPPKKLKQLFFSNFKYFFFRSSLWSFARRTSRTSPSLRSRGSSSSSSSSRIQTG